MGSIDKMADPVVNGAAAKTNGALTNGSLHSPEKGSRSRNPSSYAAKFKLAPHFIGGNHLAAAPAGTVKDFVLEHDGHTVITSVSYSFTVISEKM